MSNILCAFACNENFSSQPHTLFLFSQSWFAFRAYTLINGTLCLSAPLLFGSGHDCSSQDIFFNHYCAPENMPHVYHVHTFLNSRCLQPEKICLFLLQSPVDFRANTRRASASLRSSMRFIWASIFGPIERKIRKHLLAPLIHAI